MSSATRTTTALLVSAALTCAPALVSAQQDTTVRIDGRWRAFIGCWASFEGGPRGPDACIVPTSDSNVVELIAVDGDSILSRTQISTAGTPVSRVRGGCAGQETGRWSMDDRRVYIRAEYDCGSKGRRTWSSMYAMSGLNAFTRITGGASRAALPVRTVNFTQLMYDTTAVPLEIRRRLPAWNDPATWIARGNQAADVSAADVADAAREADAPVVEDWLIDRRQVFTLTRDDRRALRDASVPSHVVTVMDAVSQPDRFSITNGVVRKVRARKSVSRTGAAYVSDPSPFGRGKVGRETLSPLSWPLAETALPPFPYRVANNPGIWAIPQH